MLMRCAECDCLVDEGNRVLPCRDLACCCAHLPLATQPVKPGEPPRPEHPGS